MQINDFLLADFLSGSSLHICTTETVYGKDHEKLIVDQNNRIFDNY